MEPFIVEVLKWILAKSDPMLIGCFLLLAVWRYRTSISTPASRFVCSKRKLHGSRQSIPAIDLIAKAPASGCCQTVIFGSAVVIRSSPLRAQQSATFEAIKRRIKRTLLNKQRSPGDLLDPEQNSIAVLGSERDGFEDQ
jgi:hypothetical protein